MYNPPVDINAYNLTISNATIVVLAFKEVEWIRKLTALETFNGSCVGAKDLIIYRVGEDAVVSIKQRYVGYRGVNPKKIMQHIRDKTCKHITTLDKANEKNRHNKPWDTTSDINIYCKYFNDLTKKLKSRDIVTSGNKKSALTSPKFGIHIISQRRVWSNGKRRP